MYLNEVSIWNWRKFGERENGQPGVKISFNANLNVIVGENDSGKTAIIDAIKLGLNTNSQDSSWIRETDFHDSSKSIKIEYIFKELSEDEEAFFFEWIYFKESTSYLRILLEAEQIVDINMKSKITRNISGGEEGREQPLSDSVKQLLTVTYLKPLRDAELELSSGSRSRFAQILKNLSYFQNNSGKSRNKIEDILSGAFSEIQEIIDKPVLEKMNEVIEAFFEKNRKKSPEINPKIIKFEEALKKLELSLGDVGSGLGSSNLLFMAAELLLLSDNTIGAKIALIEEIEAHIHPQSQLRLIKYFERKSKDEGIQYILTSHSPMLASSISLEHIILIYNSAAYPMRSGLTFLEADDYKFLERFLDATKSNMFFAQGIICVEGDAENLLIPTLAEVINRPLHDYGVSIINVGNLAFKRYASIFLRKDNLKLNFPVSIVTDLDMKPVSYYHESICYFELDHEDEQEIKKIISPVQDESLIGLYYTFDILINKINKIIEGKLTQEQRQIIYDILVKKNTKKYEEITTARAKEIQGNYMHEVEKTKVFISSPWTLEFAIAESGLSSLLQNSILEANYKEAKNRTSKKEEWEGISDTEKRASEVYQFMIDHNVSKSVVSQLLSAKILDKRSELGSTIANDSKLKYLIDAIRHVTGGE
ncbi:ATP-dependent nuclease [Paenibacillus sp. P36]|uniref:ATP-dependent nuclease n=1 Tax=Paenibacillus sp. P36 TaxID=3342538 RepID=UPI0038B3AC90